MFILQDTKCPVQWTTWTPALVEEILIIIFQQLSFFSQTLVCWNTKLWTRCTLLGVIEKEKVTFGVNAQVHLALSTKICSEWQIWVTDACWRGQWRVVTHVCGNWTSFGRWSSFGFSRTCRWFRRLQLWSLIELLSAQAQPRASALSLPHENGSFFIGVREIFCHYK